ncbi:hypothetical protein MMC13_001103 [Lambiella insularis]|nr:hypothetical protein [Lambiella insularis]
MRCSPDSTPNLSPHNPMECEGFCPKHCLRYCWLLSRGGIDIFARLYRDPNRTETCTLLARSAGSKYTNAQRRVHELERENNRVARVIERSLARLYMDSRRLQELQKKDSLMTRLARARRQAGLYLEVCHELARISIALVLLSEEDFLGGEIAGPDREEGCAAGLANKNAKEGDSEGIYFDINPPTAEDEYEDGPRQKGWNKGVRADQSLIDFVQRLDSGLATSIPALTPHPPH